MAVLPLAFIPVEYLWFIGPEWAIPANTALLVLLAIVQHRQGRRAKDATDDARRAVKHAAHAAHTAEDAAAIVERRRQNLPDTGDRRRYTDEAQVHPIRKPR